MFEEFWKKNKSVNRPKKYSQNILHELGLNRSFEDFLSTEYFQNQILEIKSKEDLEKLTSDQLDPLLAKYDSQRIGFEIRDLKSIHPKINTFVKKQFLKNGSLFSVCLMRHFREENGYKFKIELNHQLLTPLNQSVKLLIPHFEQNYFFDYSKSSSKCMQLNLAQTPFSIEEVTLSPGESYFIPFGMIYGLDSVNSDECDFLVFKESEVVLSEALEFVREKIFKNLATERDVFSQLDKRSAQDLISKISYDPVNLVRELRIFLDRKKLIKFKYGLK